jgi:hypothetical protein
MRHAVCLPARMGGGGKTGIDALARASGPCPPHGGVYFRFREREGKALGVPVKQEQRRSADHHRNAANNGTLATAGRRWAVRRQAKRRQGRCPKGTAPPVPSESTPVARPARIEASVPCGSSKEHRALGSATRGKERDRNPSRASSHTTDRHPNGPGLQARFAQADRAGCPTGQPVN